MNSSLLADIVLVLHFLYAGFVAAGFVAIPAGAWLRWRWVRLRWLRLLHLIMIEMVGAETLAGMACPLTEWEYALRERAGQRAEEGTFIGRLVSALLYYELPPWVFAAAYLALTALALAWWFWIPPRRREG